LLLFCYCCNHARVVSHYKHVQRRRGVRVAR
jgi:hypothetical protein